MTLFRNTKQRLPIYTRKYCRSSNIPKHTLTFYQLITEVTFVIPYPEYATIIIYVRVFSF